MAGEAYADRAAPIGHGQTISQPYMVALMTERLDVKPEHKVLEIGTGSGYQTAILARLCREVYSIERVKPLLDDAFHRLGDLNYRNVHFRHGDGTLGWAEGAPFDRVIIAAGAPSVPQKLLLEQMSDGGLAVLPVGPEDEQMLVVVKRDGEKLHTTDVCPCRFVKLIGREGWESDKK
jgi:protein-L-isoaspartate(D-aspartate) O-methyltransferase